MFVDAEALFIGFLKAALPGESVSAAVPNPRPAAFLQVFRSGGSASSIVLDRPSIAITAWGSDGASRPVASDRANVARQLLLDPNTWRRLPAVTRIEEITGLYYDPDPETEAPRYSFAVRAFVRAKF